MNPFKKLIQRTKKDVSTDAHNVRGTEKSAAQKPAISQSKWKDRLPSIIVGVTVPSVLATLAIANPGVMISEIELNDGAVWVTNSAELKIGRYNAEVKELNGGVISNSRTFDVLQYENDAVAVESASVSKIDPATMSYTSIAQIPPQSKVAMSDGIVSIADPTGRIWVAPIEELDTITESTPVTLDLSDGAITTIGPNKTVYAFDPGTGNVHVIGGEGEDAEEQRIITLDGANGIAISENPDLQPQISMLGTMPIVLANSTIYTPKTNASLNLVGGQPVLQGNGPTRGEALVATDTGLVTVSTDSGSVTKIVEGVNGKPAQPIFLNGCAYSAWASAEKNYAVLCGDDSTGTTQPDSAIQTLENLSPVSELVFRVNRDKIILNDTLAGRVWLPENMPQSEDPNWNDIEAPDDTDESPEESDNEDTEQSDTAQCATTDRAPRAKNDSFGVRAGRTVSLPVLSNDSVGQCGIIAITKIEEIPKSFGTVQLIENGRSLQVNVAPSATGTAKFEYTITDGRGQNPPSIAEVELEVVANSLNSKPEATRDTRLEVELGATVSHNVLANFADPDGDQLVLTNATLEGEVGAVRFRKNGMVSYVADSQQAGMQSINVTVSDGKSDVTETVIVDVRNEGTLAPTINPIYRVGYVSSQVEVDVLAAVKQRAKEEVRLAAVDEVAGTTIEADLESGKFMFSAPTPGSYYVSFTLVSSPHTVSGLARIDIREIPSERLPPVAVSDVALLPEGGNVTVDPMANDFDPNGGVMVLTGLEAENGSALSVGVIEHRFVKIESRVALTEPETISYTVDNGYSTARGSILVQPVEPSSEQRAPTIKPINVSVRTGGVVTIPVLDYANDADGDEVTLVRELPEQLDEQQGLLFVSGNLLRYQAPDNPQTTTTSFAIEDSAGNTTIGSLTVNVHTSSPETKAPPTPKRITARAYAGETIRIPIQLTGIDPDGDGVILLGQGEKIPTQGRVSGVGADWLEYVAMETGRGTDTFNYAVEDWTGQRAVGTINVGIVEKPSDALPIVASDDEVTVQPGTTVAVRVTRNDVDPSGLALTVDPLTQLSGITAEVRDNQIVVQVPDSALESYVIPYTVRNQAGGVGEAQLIVKVSREARILPPSINDIVVSPFEVVDKTSVEVDIFAVAENPSGTPQELDLSIPSSHSQIAAVTAQGKVTVQLAATAQTIPFRLTNPAAPDSAYTYAFIMVPALGDFPPALRPKSPELVTSSGQEIQIPLAQYVYVGSGKTPIVRDVSSVQSAQSDGTELVVDSGTLRFVPQRSFHGTAAITFEVWDSESPNGKSSILTLPITVRPSEELPPTFQSTVLQIPQGNEVIKVDLAQFTKTAAGMPEQTYGYAMAATPAYAVSATVDGTLLSVSAPANATRGTRGELSLTLTYGVANKLNVVVPFEIVASTKQRPAVREHELIANAGEPKTVNVLDGSVDPVGEGLRVIGVKVLTADTGTAEVANNRVTVTPAEGFAGTMRVSYTVTDSLNDPNRNVDGSIQVTVRKEPEAPNTPRVSNPSNQTVTVAWDAPTANGAPIVEYRVTASPAGTTTMCKATTCEVSGLRNGTEYRFTVAARNEVGFSQESALSSPIVPDILPEAPNAPATVFGDKQFTATWNAPANEGSAIQRYILEISPGIGGEGITERNVSGTSATINGARNGTAYTVRVRAVNAALTEGGQGPWSPLSEKVIPAGVPDAPKVGASLPDETPLGKQINVSWAPSSENGDKITSYTLVVLSGATEVLTKKMDASNTKFTFTEAENGVDYRFRVHAHNKAGVSEGGLSDLISSFTAPSAPRVKATEVVADRSYSQGGAVKYVWDVPLETGGTGIKISHYEVRNVASKISGTSYLKEEITPGQNSGDIAVRACNQRGACSDWTALTGVNALTKPQSPTITVHRTGAYEQYGFTFVARSLGGAQTATYEYRFDGGSWQTVPGNMTINGTVTDFGSADSKDVYVEARATNSQGTSPVSDARATVLKPQPPTAPVNVSLQTHEWNDHVIGSWQQSTARGIDITKYEYCLTDRTDTRTCGTYSSGVLGEIKEVPATATLRTDPMWVPPGATYKLQVWAVGRDSGGRRVTSPISATTLIVPEPTPTPTPSTEPTPTPSTTE